MRAHYLLFIFFLLIGCSQLKGDKGDTGERGEPAQITIYSGLVNSDAQVISVPEYHGTVDISVSVGNGVDFTETPYYAPALGINVYYAAKTYVVTLYNAQTAAATHYRIVVVREVSGSGLSRLIT